MSKSLRNWSHHIQRYSNYLLRDEKIENDDQEAIHNHIDIVQNNVDAAQWLAISIEHLKSIAVPVAAPGTIRVLPKKH